MRHIQAEASDIGFTLLRIGYYNVDGIQAGLAERVRAIGRELHLVETMRLAMDGGRSMEAIIERVQSGHDQLNKLIGDLDNAVAANTASASRRA